MPNIDGFRRILINSGEQIKADDLNLFQHQIHMLILDMFRLPGIRNAIQNPDGGLGGMLDPEDASYTLSDDNPPFDMAFCPFPSHGYVIAGAGARQLVLGTPGPIIQANQLASSWGTVQEDDTTPLFLPYWMSAGEFTLTTAVGDAANPRIDLVEMKLELTDRDAETVVFAENAVAATLDLDPLSSNIDTTVKAKVGGKGGNNITFRTVADGAGVGSLTESGNAVTFHYQTGVTTVTNLETAIGTSTLIEVDAPGTGANILVSPGDTIPATALAGGVNPIVMSASFNKARRTQATFQIKQGVAAGTPAYPSPTAGFVPIAAVYVPALHNAVHTDAHIRDMRWPLGGLQVYDTHYNEVNVAAGGTAWTVDDANWRVRSGAAAGFAYAPLKVAGRGGRLVAVQTYGEIVTTGANKTAKLKKMYHNGLGGVSYETICDLTTEIYEPLTSGPGVAMAHALHFMDENSRDVGTRVASTRIGTPIWLNGDSIGPGRLHQTVVAEGDQFGQELAGLVMEYQYDVAGDANVGRTRWFVLHGMG